MILTHSMVLQAELLKDAACALVPVTFALCVVVFLLALTYRVVGLILSIPFDIPKSTP